MEPRSRASDAAEVFVFVDDTMEGKISSIEAIFPFRSQVMRHEAMRLILELSLGSLP